MALSTKTIKRRIKSIANTKKITKAMEMISAVKMRRAVANASATRNYAELAWQMLQDVVKQAHVSLHPLLVVRPVKKIGLILITSNRGLAGVSICIGGDGTILFAHHKNRLEGKILGIGSKTSYLCQIRNYNWKEKLIPILEADDTFAPLSLVCSTSNSKPSLYTAINDFVIHSIDYRVVEISLLVKSPASQTKEFSFRGDGLIVSTPIGSNERSGTGVFY
jgi:ATP synthase F1 gamma subunit